MPKCISYLIVDTKEHYMYIFRDQDLITDEIKEDSSDFLAASLKVGTSLFHTYNFQTKW